MSPNAAATNQRFDPNSYPLTPGVRLLEASAGTEKPSLSHTLCCDWWWNSSCLRTSCWW